MRTAARISAVIFTMVMFSGIAWSEDSSSADQMGWFARVDRTQAEQPHWITPLVTVTPRLEEEFRFDVSREHDANGNNVINYGGSKGLELIPAERVEIIVGVPPYLVHSDPAIPDGFGDLSALVKYRVVAANEEKGAYIVTVFLGATFPTGSNGNGAKHAVVTPTIAYGKGWGPIDLQGTVGIGIPTADVDILGRTITWNNALQYHVAKRLWPQLEANVTHYSDGPRDGKTQVLLTPGVLVGRLQLSGRLAATFGAGVQIPVSTFHVFESRAIISARLPF
jgi:hypothetical protein